MKILLHSSKTMKLQTTDVHELTKPQFIDQATQLNSLLRDMNAPQLMRLMNIKEKLADAVVKQAAEWTMTSTGSAAALTFRGDIFSGLSAADWSKDDATFAQQHLLIMSGLYGLLRPFDAIQPYRLEMGYKLLVAGNQRLTAFWEQRLADTLDANDTYVNLTAKEYFTVIEKQLSDATVVSPNFLTINEKTKQPTFVVVHAKIARGSFASWLIKGKIDDLERLKEYNQLHYKYDAALSSPAEPVFVCENFGGLGLSVRLN